MVSALESALPKADAEAETTCRKKEALKVTAWTRRNLDMDALPRARYVSLASWI